MFLKMKAGLGLVLAFLCIAHYSFGQDSNAQVEWYESFFKEQNQKPVEEALHLAETERLQAHEAKKAVEEVNALTTLSLLHLARMNSHEKALEYLIQSLIIEDSLGLKREKIFTCLTVSRVFENVGDYAKCLEFLTLARDLADTLNDNALEALVLNELGRVNAARGSIREAFHDYELLLEYADELRQPAREADALFHLARLYVREKMYEEALAIYKKALAIRRELRDKPGEASSLNDIGELYNLTNNPDRALANHVAALEIRQALDDNEGLAESYNNVGLLYYQQKNFQRAISNLQLALQAGRKAQSQHQIRKSYEYLSQCYKGLKKFEEALKYKEQWMDINEFIQNEINEHQLQERQNSYVINKKEKEIDQLQLGQLQHEKEIETQKKLRNFLFLLIGLSGIIVVLILYLYIAKQRSNRNLQAANEKVKQQNNELQDLNATKNKFFSIIGHDIKGPLHSLSSFSNLLIHHTDSLTKDEIKMLAIDLDKSLKNLFALLENLLEWSRAQTGNIEFKPENFDLTALLTGNEELLKTQALNKKITIVNNRKSEIKIRAHKHSINTVIRNLLSNAIKFTPEGGTITLNAQPEGGNIKVSITDTGVGMTEEVVQKLFRLDSKHSTKGTADEKGTGLGLILCKEFVEKNGGHIGVVSEVGKGSVFYFTLPA